MAAVVDFDFEVPQSCEAHEPPEARGLARDEVRLMVATRSNGKLVHARFNELPRFLRAGDLVVVNTSSQIPAAVAATRPDGTALELRLSTPVPDGRWLAELRLGSERFTGGDAGERLALPNGAHALLVSRYADSRRLWVTELKLPKPLDRYLADHGRPIRYGYASGQWPLEAYKNVYALEPGSVEPPSAGRPFTRELLTRLVAKGMLVAPIVLHTGVSSLERDERPYPEWYRVPEHTAAVANAVHGWGGRVVAVGTTVARALETVTSPDGNVASGEGWTSLVITPERGLHGIDGLITGLHEPRASHLDLLEASAGEQLLERSYLAALEHCYLWHEFGESQLILP
jgi:S-adenosylmethionine:tRNA ribosyltransferase-isomerase